MQGSRGGGLAPVEQAILVDTFPAHKRASAFAVFIGIAIVTAPAIGPTLGGWITDSYSWRLDLFYQYFNRDTFAVSIGRLDQRFGRVYEKRDMRTRIG